MSWPFRWTRTCTRRRSPRGACLASHLDARLTRRRARRRGVARSRGRPGGRASRRGGAHLAVVAVEAVELAAQLDARLDVAEPDPLVGKKGTEARARHRVCVWLRLFTRRTRRTSEDAYGPASVDARGCTEANGCRGMLADRGALRLFAEGRQQRLRRGGRGGNQQEERTERDDKSSYRLTAQQSSVTFPLAACAGPGVCQTGPVRLREPFHLDRMAPHRAGSGLGRVWVQDGDHAVSFRWERRDRHRRPGRRGSRSLSCRVWARPAALRPKTRAANPDPVDAYPSDPASLVHGIEHGRAAEGIRSNLESLVHRVGRRADFVRTSCFRSGASVSGEPCSRVPPVSPMITPSSTPGAYPPRPSDVVTAPMGIGAQRARPTNRAAMPSNDTTVRDMLKAGRSDRTSFDLGRLFDRPLALCPR